MAVDGIFHVMRTFEDVDITHVEDRIGMYGVLQLPHVYGAGACL